VLTCPHGKGAQQARTRTKTASRFGIRSACGKLTSFRKVRGSRPDLVDECMLCHWPFSSEGMDKMLSSNVRGWQGCVGHRPCTNHSKNVRYSPNPRQASRCKHPLFGAHQDEGAYIGSLALAQALDPEPPHWGLRTTSQVAGRHRERVFSKGSRQNTS
jgi:hypothetical protein